MLPPTENFFRIPSLNKNPVKSSVIAVIDSSGSMSSWWPTVAESWNNILSQNPEAIAITFSNSAKIIKGPLTSRIQDYEGGGTEIEKGFQELNSILKSDANIHPNLTILFVSDGCDNQPSSLVSRLQKLSFQIDKTKKCNFLSMAVGKGFPTFIAMELRTMYHNGDSNLPPVFLIEQPSKESIVQQFNLLTPYLVHKPSYAVKPEVKAFPWSKGDKIAHEGQWVMTHAKTLEIEGEIYEVLEKDMLGITDFIDIIKCWHQELQLLSIKKKVKSEADMAIELIQEMKGIFTKQTKQEKKEKLSFFDRIMKKSGNDLFQDLNFLVKEIKSFSEENLLSKLSEAEAAKRLAIGTKVGKYHSKAMELKGITVEDYSKMKEDFLKLLDNFKLNPESSQEPSLILLQNQKEIFLEKDLRDGIKLCQSQYHLVEELPLVGHSIRVRRPDGASINPYLIEVKDIAKHHKILDTVSIQNNSNELKLKVGMDDEEIINAVLPLFDEKDYDLQPYINSKLYHLLMTFNVTQNVDTLLENTYSALLSAATVFLLSQPESEWRDSLLEMINKTFKITYANSLGFKKYSEILVKEPNMAMVTDHPEAIVKCEELSKPILVLNYLKLKDKECVKNIMKRMFIEYFGRTCTSETMISDYYCLEDEKAFEKVDMNSYYEKVMSKYTKDVLNSFYTKYELKDDISKEVYKLDLKVGFDFNIKLNEKNLYANNFKINLRFLEKVHEYFVGEEVNKKEYFIWVFHAFFNQNSFERNTTQIVEDVEKINQNIKMKLTSEFFKSQNILEKIWEKLQVCYSNIIMEQHRDVTPMTNKSLRDYCTAHGQDPNLFKFNNCSNLLTNACLSPDCPFYMKLNPSLAQHLDSYPLIPAFNKTIKILKNEKDNEVILDSIANMKHIDLSLPVPKMEQAALKDKEHILALIEKLKNFYLNNNE